MGSKPSTQEKVGLDQNKQSYATGSNTLNDVTGDLGYYSGDPTKSGLYRSLMTTKTDATNQAYNNAKSANTLHAQVAGFGYSSPIGQASNFGVENARASDLSRIPGEALDETTNKQLLAEQIKSGVGSDFLNNATGSLNASTSAYKARKDAQAALWGSIAKAGAEVGSAAAMG